MDCPPYPPYPPDDDDDGTVMTPDDYDEQP